MLLSLQAVGGNLKKTGILALISECRGCEGADVVQLGRLSTGAIKGALRVAAVGDREMREVLKLARGLNSISIFDYDGCSDADKMYITGRLDALLSGSEVLMEAKDGSERLRIFGVVDDRTDNIRDIVLYAPASCSLICLFGSIPVDKAVHIIDND